MAHVRSLVGIDAGVLNQTEPLATHTRMFVCRDATDHRGAVQLQVQITGTGDFDRSNALNRRELGLQLRSDRARSLLQPLRQLKRDGHSHLAQLDLGRQFNVHESSSTP